MWFPGLSKSAHPLAPDRQLLMKQMHFSASLSVRPTRNSLLSAGKASNTTSQSYFRGITSSPALCHHLVHRDLDHLSLPQDITLVHYIDNSMLIGPSKQEVATTPDLLERHLHARRWKINLKKKKNRGPSTPVKSPGVQ